MPVFCFLRGFVTFPSLGEGKEECNGSRFPFIEWKRKGEKRENNEKKRKE